MTEGSVLRKACSNDLKSNNLGEAYKNQNQFSAFLFVGLNVWGLVAVTKKRVK